MVCKDDDLKNIIKLLNKDYPGVKISIVSDSEIRVLSEKVEKTRNRKKQLSFF